MKRAVFVVIALLLQLSLGANGNDKPRLTFMGLGNIRIGMAEENLKTLGFRLTSQGPWGEVGDPDFRACHYLDSAPNFPGVAVMINEGKVVRIDIGFRSSAENWQSLSGAKIGMTEASVSEIYGDWLKISGHPYLDNAGSYLTLTSSNGKYAMIFETSVGNMTDKGMEEKIQPKYVTDFRAGLAGPVSYVEGCA
ncbi:hypothetical protein [Parasphingorhabdus sp.]|uniref:hypothetical protein n=1 Tax=Parasphingorhabdus sp. TaxID=2709688 RepID=UPI003A9243AB